MKFNGKYSGEKQLVWDFYTQLKQCQSSEDQIVDTVRKFVHPDGIYNGCHPINTLYGADVIADKLFREVCRSFPDWERRDDIFIASEFKGNTWVSATGYYLGSFLEDFLGIPASGRIIHLRFGEFVKVIEGRISEWICMFDLIDLMRQIGLKMFSESLGMEGFFQGPATHDGIQLNAGNLDETKKSIDLVEDMIFKGLMSYDGKTLESMGQQRYWHPEMMWYGPSGIGTTRGLEGFQRDHQISFLTAFPDRKGGDHRSRVAEGMYVASTGWPSIKATHAGGGFLGMPPTGRSITMRVMDWWRREGDMLKENWVFIDLPDLLLQMGYDMFARALDLFGRKPS